jgi:CheY-like chemotaxis protein
MVCSPTSSSPLRSENGTGRSTAAGTCIATGGHRPAPAGDAERGRAVPVDPVTILLLDEEPLLRRATALLLEKLGGQVTPAASADDAAAKCGAHYYDVAILDLAPDGPCAGEVLAGLQAGGLPPRRVIAVTAAPLPSGEASRFAAVVTKPYPFDALVRAVFGAGARRRTRSGIFERARLAAARGPVTARAPEAPAAAPGPGRAARAERGRGR